LAIVGTEVRVGGQAVGNRRAVRDVAPTSFLSIPAQVTLPSGKTIVSERFDSGVDPIAEVKQRGTILAIVRLGNQRPVPAEWTQNPRGARFLCSHFVANATHVAKQWRMSVDFMSRSNSATLYGFGRFWT